MSLEDTEEKIERRKRAFECEIKNTCDIENQIGMTLIHDN